MGKIESIIRPDNPKREQQVRDLVLDINSDLQFICTKSNDIISTMNQLLHSDFAHVVYDTHNPKQLLEDIRERFTQVEALARWQYEKLDAGVDKPPIEENIKTAIAASLAIFVVLGPTLTAMFGFMGTVAAGVISRIGGVFVYIVVEIIAAEEKYHKLEEAISQLTKTKQLLDENREKIANAADQLKMAVRLAQALGE